MPGLFNVRWQRGAASGNVRARRCQGTCTHSLAPTCTAAHAHVLTQTPSPWQYQAAAAAAKLSDTGKDAFAELNLEHSHLHSNVRWKKCGIPPVQVPKKKVWLELLHTIPLNAAKLQVKHAVLKYMSDDIRAEAGRKFRSWGIPIDTRKPEKRTEEKWPGGGQ